MKLFIVWGLAVLILIGLLFWFILFNPTETPTIKYKNGVVLRGDCEWLREEWDLIKEDTQNEVCESVCKTRFCPFGVLNESDEMQTTSGDFISIRRGRCWEACYK